MKKKLLAYEVHLTPPNEEEVRAARAHANLSQSKAAALVHRTQYQRWQEWESGKIQMPMDAWELFLVKTGQRSIEAAQNTQEIPNWHEVERIAA